MTTIEVEIRKLYDAFFLDEGINRATGVSAKSKVSNRKFASYPYVGSSYGQDKHKRVLFIGLDIGRDESKGGILDFETKRKVVEGLHTDTKKMNRHISGLYTTTLFFTRNAEWEKVKNERSHKAAVNNWCRDENLLSDTALVNLFKYVTEGRDKRTGGTDRIYFNREKELRLLLDEVKILKPDVIVLQSKVFGHPKYKEFLKELKEQYKNKQICIAPHPSGPSISQVPEKYVTEFEFI